MIQVLRSAERGYTETSWLESRHSFSFADYRDPAKMGFRALRVINDDTIAPGKGFPAHSHRDMEILTYVIDGALQHKDSMGNGSVIESGMVQRMSAGTGVTHSEFNASQAAPVRLLQIWILPERAGIAPGYEERSFSPEQRRGQLRLVASHDAREGSVRIHQDADVFATLLDAGTQVRHEAKPGRHLWLQLASGRVRAAGQMLEAGDGLAVSRESELTIEALEHTEALMFDLA